ncbi:hypothetical protein COI63_34450 [Bacillus toyonensis]|uniref:hypothetical protein n=1 Tax=Bacillus toyonensis TaxID=155322 RepID=UPI000BF18C34|nr:hypothetical protein [Bacillus toyonensis]PEO55423.1 hypothetical protein CN579_21995 [Bacillus toyonensis]PHF87934.1 hypothetical protein COI63_34450 [Bacillus toyonensis]
MDESIWRTKPSNTLHLRPIHRYRIDPNKIKSVQDAIEILKRIPMYVDDEGLKGIEHLIEKEDSQNG